MDYRKSWEDAEAEMLQTQRINRQYGTRSGVTKPATSGKTDTKSTKKNTKQTNSAGTNKGGTHSARGKISNSRQNRSDSESRQGIHKNGSSWYNPDGFTQTDTWLRDIRRRMGVPEDSGIAKTNFAGSSSSSKSNASSAAAKSSVKHASDFTNYVNDTIKSTAKNSTEPSPLDFGRYGAVGKEAKTLTNDLAARIARLKPEDRPTPDEMDFMSGMMSGDKHFVQQNEALKRSFWNASGAPKAPDFPVWKNTFTQSNPPSDPAEIQVLKKVEQKAKELLPPPRETNPKRDLEAELALRRRLAPIDPTTMDPSVVDSIYQDLDTIAYLDDPNNRKILIQGESLVPPIETNTLRADEENALLEAQKTIFGSFTDEQRAAIENGANASNFIADLSLDDQDKLIDAGIYLISKMDDQQRSDWLFLSSWMLNGIPLEQRKAILQHMKATGGDIDLQTLTNLGVYTQADAAAGYTADVFGGLLKENYGKNFVDSLRKEYQSHQLGTSFAEMNQEEMNLRIAQIGGLLAENIANVANGIVFGKNSRFFGNGKFDQLESTGYAGPSYVPGSQHKNFGQFSSKTIQPFNRSERTHPQNTSKSFRKINSKKIRFSQSSVNNSDELILSMQTNGWKGAPIDVVEMPDGKLTTLDNTRVAAARKTHTKIHAYVHHYNDPLPPELIIRFTTKNGIPKTWGDAINLRIRKQKAEFRKNSAYGSFDIPQINS